MKLADTLKDVVEQVKRKIGPEETAAIQAEIVDILDLITVDALKSGDLAPDFELNDDKGNTHSLDEMLEKGLVIISFNRGAWCPYCQQEIIALQSSMGLLNDLDVSAVVISPFKSELWTGYKDENDIDIPILLDVDNQTAEKYGVGFTEPAALKRIHTDVLGLDFNEYYGATAGKLPVPAIYVVGQDKKIIYDYVNPDWQKRAEPEEYCKVVRGVGR